MTNIHWDTGRRGAEFLGYLGKRILYRSDIFSLAAQCGSTDALRAFLNLARSKPTLNEPIQGRDFRLLNIACGNAQFETALFL